MSKAKIKVPSSAKKGEIIEIKTSIGHDMETGQRKDKDGKTIPRQIINRFVCKYNGAEVFTSDFYPAISANPYLSFYLAATESGKIEFQWIADNGEITEASADITVS